MYIVGDKSIKFVCFIQYVMIEEKENGKINLSFDLESKNKFKIKTKKGKFIFKNPELLEFKDGQFIFELPKDNYVKITKVK